MKVLVVDRADYTTILRSIHGLRGSGSQVAEADLVIDRDTGKILKSRFF